jgi:hypothetical protein
MNTYTDASGNVLCWNGEVWDGLVGLKATGSDTQAMMKAIRECLGEYMV